MFEKTKSSGSASHEKSPVDKGEAKIETPVHNIDETPSPVIETAPLPAVVEAQATDPVMEEMLRQKKQLLEEIEHQEMSYAEEIKKPIETLERQRVEFLEKERKRRQ